MTSTVAIFHGYGGNKPSSWLTWLNNQLTAKGISTIYPSFPPLGSSTIASWYDELEKFKDDFKAPITLVGHSAGTTFALYVAQHSKIKIEKMVLVCPLNNLDGAEHNRPGTEAESTYIRHFVHQNFDFDLIKSHVKEVIFILSDDDPNVPYTRTINYFRKIFPQAKFITLHNYGHINEKSGITQLPQVLENITK